MRYLLIIFALMLLPLPSSAQGIDTDLGIYASGIFFSGPLIAGDEVRLYATIINEGDVDVSGYASFWQGETPIGDSQVISVRANGADDEVYVDFVVPSGTFNIRAEIKGTDPQDQNGSNDSAMTNLFTPVFDDDRDGIANDDDNCQQEPNVDQLDSDFDGKGNACDDDDDNDGLTDGVENELGTNTLSADTDGDGVMDPNDAFPNDPSQTQRPSLPDSTEGNEIADEVFENLANTILENIDAEEDPEETGGQVLGEVVENDQVDQTLLAFSPDAIFSYQRLDWNKFAFRALTPRIDGYRYEWDFGDGVSSNRKEVEHTFQGSGDFDVTLTLLDPNGTAAYDDTIIRVPFFTLGNPLVLGIIGLLMFFLLLGVLFVTRFMLVPPAKEIIIEEENEVSTGPRKIKVRKE